MFSVLFEVRPRTDRKDAYLAVAKMLRPELEAVVGFVENVRYRSLTRDGWLLSLSSWRDEKSVVRWRTTARHHLAQKDGRSEILAEYHLRVGEFTADTHLPPGHAIRHQRLDETEIGEGSTATLIDAKATDGFPLNDAMAVAKVLGLDPAAPGLVGWDAYEAILSPGDLILMMVWKTAGDAQAFAHGVSLPPGGRLRQVRIVRDYGMFDRREAPQYYPEAAP